MAGSLHSDHINYLILRYLQEHGHENAAIAFHKDWHRPYHYRDPEALPFAGVVKRDALISVVQDGLYFDQLSAEGRKAHRKYRFTAVNPRAPLDEQDIEGLQDGGDASSRPSSSGKRKERPSTMRAPDEFPTPASKRQRRSEGNEAPQVNGDAMEVDEVSPAAEADEDAEVASPAAASEVDVIEVPERYDSMDVAVQTEIRTGPKTSTMYWKIDKPGAIVLHSMWSPSTEPNNANMLLTVGESLCRYYEIPDARDGSQQITHTDDPHLPPSGMVTASAWHPKGHTAACAMDTILRLSDGDKKPPVQLVLNHGRERGNTIWDAGPDRLDPSGVILCLRYSLSGKYLLVLRTNLDRGLVQIWQAPQPADNAANAPSQPIASHHFDRQAFDACWTGDEMFLICGDNGLCCAYQVDDPSESVTGRSGDYGLIERSKEVIGFVCSWDRVRYDEALGILAVASSSSQAMATLPINPDHPESIPKDVNLDGQPQLPGRLTAMAFQPRHRGKHMNPVPESEEVQETGALIATTFEEGYCVIYRLNRPDRTRTTSEKIVTLDMHGGPALALSWSPHGSHLAFGNADVVYVYDLDTLGRNESSRHEPLVTWRPDPEALAAGKKNGEHEWDHQEVLTEPSLSWSSDGESLGYAADRQLAVIRFRPPLHNSGEENSAQANGEV